MRSGSEGAVLRWLAAEVRILRRKLESMESFIAKKVESIGDVEVHDGPVQVTPQQHRLEWNLEAPIFILGQASIPPGEVVDKTVETGLRDLVTEPEVNRGGGKGIRENGEGVGRGTEKKQRGSRGDGEGVSRGTEKK